MSPENAEVVVRGLDAYNTGDTTALREIYDPAAVMYHLDGWPEPGPSVGRDAVVRELQFLRDAWETGDMMELAGQPVEVGNRVLVRAVWHVTSRVPYQAMEFSVIFTFRTGKVILQEYFWDHAEALAAVGLRE